MELKAGQTGVVEGFFSREIDIIHNDTCLFAVQGLQCNVMLSGITDICIIWNLK